MNLDKTNEKLTKYGQTHLLSFFDELSDSEKNDLISQIEETDFEVIRAAFGAEDNKKGVITPLKAMELSEINENKAEFDEIGVNAIKDNKVAAVLLAGGMGTRLGSSNPKGMYNVGISRELFIFECLINNLMDVTNRVGNFIHLFVMTSEKNNDATINFFEEKNYFGYPKAFVHFFKQEMAPATDYEGKIYLETKSRLATSPNGNGGWFSSLKKAGLDSVLHDNGIEWLNIFAVDNVLQKIADPVFVGATIKRDVAVGAKVVRKNHPDEGVGVMCLEDGRPSIIEYYELTDELKSAVDESGNPAYNFGVILNYLFNVSALEALADDGLPLHIVKKKIEHIDNTGNPVKPSEPNGFKYENLVLDMIHMMSGCLPFEVVREHEFAPIKNLTGIDSVESARALLTKNGVEL